MKYNLKNRPKTQGSMPYLPLGGEWETYLTELDKWFEGFEKELREMMATSQVKKRGYVKVIKEILENVRVLR